MDSSVYLLIMSCLLPEWRMNVHEVKENILHLILRNVWLHYISFRFKNVWWSISNVEVRGFRQ